MNLSNDKKMAFGAFTVLAVGIMLPITLFLVSRPQDIRQRAAGNASFDPTPTPIPPGCPAKNADGSTNICRTDISCPLGETEKANGKQECTSRLGTPSICCIHI